MDSRISRRLVTEVNGNTEKVSLLNQKNTKRTHFCKNLFSSEGNNTGGPCLEIKYGAESSSDTVDTLLNEYIKPGSNMALECWISTHTYKKKSDSPQVVQILIGV